MLEVYESIKEKINSILNEAEDIQIKLSSPEILIDKKLTKYYSMRFNELSKIIEYIKEYNLALEIMQKDIDENMLNKYILKFINFYSKKACSKSANIEFEGAEENVAILKALCENYLIDNNIDYKILNDRISINKAGIYELVEILNGLYLVNNKKTYIYVTTKDDLQFEFDEDKVKIDIFRASKKGGQNVNKVESAIRATYIDTNDVVICQDERSQLQNKQKAILRLKEEVLKNWKNYVALEIADAKLRIKNSNSVTMQINKETTKNEFYAKLLVKVLN